MPRPHLIRDDAGSALVEFALVVPLLMLLLFGITEFGRALNYWIDETHLANEAARFAAVNRNPGTSLTLQQFIQSQATTTELRNGEDTNPSGVPTAGRAKVCINFLTADPKVGDPVEAKVTAQFNWLPLIGNALGGVTSTTITGKATMRLEAKPTNYAAGCSW